MAARVTCSGNRDPRFVTLRRGGTLDDETHRLLARWAADCAARVLALFEHAMIPNEETHPHAAEGRARARAFAGASP